MRWLAPSLVALALVFSTGGVAIVGRADSSSVSGSISDEKPALDQKPEAQSQCGAPPMARRTATPARTEPRIATENKSIVLNTNGYNYPLEGQWHPDPVASPQGVPDGVLPQDREAVPAAPEAK